jgi:glycosyltransferase involved in cell wall biosynthesis
MGHERLLAHLASDAPNEVERRFSEALSGDGFTRAALDRAAAGVERAPVRRVALIAESFLPKVDGVSKTAYLALRYLQATGREVLVFAPDIAPTVLNGSRVVPLPSLGLWQAPETRMALPHPMVAHELAAFRPDLVHMFSPAILSVSGMQWARQNRVPVIANYQTDLPAYAAAYGMPLLSPVIRDWLRYLHNGCHLTLAPSYWTIRQLQAEGYHRLRRWGRGVNSTHFHPDRRTEAMRARLLAGRDPRSLLVVYVGRLANEKRIDLLVEAARTPGIAVTLIGDGAQREELEARFAGTGTHFTGYLFGDALAEAFASADVFAFPSPTETFGQVVQEAMASGLPCVVIDQGGVLDLVQPGVNGFWAENDPASFAAALVRLRDDATLRAGMAHASRRFVEDNAWEVVLGQLEGYYHEAIALNDRWNRLYPPTFFETLLGVTGRLRLPEPDAESFYDRVS